MDEPLYFENDGPIISRTNYFKSTYQKNNIIFLSWNASTARILIPDGLKANLQEMSNAKYVIISRGFWKDMGVENAIELLFEDGSDNPFCIFLSPEQTDRLIPEMDQGGGEKFFVSVYVRMGEKFRFPAKYRLVDTIPYLEPWEEH
jgi:hypothetical protein